MSPNDSNNLKTTVTTALGIIQRSPKNLAFGGHWERLYTIKDMLDNPEKLIPFKKEIEID